MDIISVHKMREADQYTISKGTPSKELMRRAAQGVFDTYPGWVGAKTLIVCGPGNNGGDGYALASIMKEKDLDVTVLCALDKFSEDGSFYHKQCTEKGVPMLIFDPDTIDFKSYQIIVDCLLGTGFQGVPRDPIASIIEEINYARETAEIYVIQVDINSGMNGDNGEAEIAVVSDLTVSIGFYKTGLFSGKAPELIGGLANVDIGIMMPD